LIGEKNDYSERFAKLTRKTVFVECDEIVDNPTKHEGFIEPNANTVVVNLKSIEPVGDIRVKTDVDFELLTERRMQAIIKRILFEFQNDDNVYLSDELELIIRKFYSPSCINVVYMNSVISKSYPCHEDWLILSRKVNKSFLAVEKVNRFGEAELKHQKDRDLISCTNAKLIGYMKLESDSIVNSNFVTTTSNSTGMCAIDMLITDQGVFEFNRRTNEIVLIEIAQDMQLENLVKTVACRFSCDVNNLKMMAAKLS
jgi:hypothetical protein